MTTNNIELDAFRWPGHQRHGFADERPDFVVLERGVVGGFVIPDFDDDDAVFIGEVLVDGVEMAF